MKFRLLTSADWKRVAAYVRSLPKSRPKLDDDGKPTGATEAIPYSVEVVEIKRTRTWEQNARYWALVTAISQQMPPYMEGVWHAPEVWHEYLKTRFLGVEAGPFGHPVPKSTARLKVGEFSDYMTEVEAWAADTCPEFNFDYSERAA